MDKKKILLVDDEQGLVDTIAKRLDVCGYDIISANDGQKGYELACNESPDLIILDIMLPKMDGYKVCGFLKKDSRYSGIPIILLTAKADEGDMKLGMEMGAEVYMTKPVVVEQLIQRIEELLKVEEKLV